MHQTLVTLMVAHDAAESGDETADGVAASRACTRCESPALPEITLCERHRDERRECDRRGRLFLRLLRRDNGQCADCGAPSHLYRCPGCAEAKKLRDCGVLVRHPEDS
ncbi:MAG: hypothetical protein H0U12_07210 [Thermoleophilaceae bacterium]|nr:hypothetical protein [Thermoleophilaceae bacterium]